MKTMTAPLPLLFFAIAAGTVSLVALASGTPHVAAIAGILTVFLLLHCVSRAMDASAQHKVQRTWAQMKARLASTHSSLDDAWRALDVPFQDFVRFIDEDELVPLIFPDGTVLFHNADVNALVLKLIEKQKEAALMYSLDFVERDTAKGMLGVGDGLLDTMAQRGVIPTRRYKKETWYFRPALEAALTPSIGQREMPQEADLRVWDETDVMTSALLRSLEAPEGIVSPRLWRSRGKLYAFREDVVRMHRFLAKALHDPALAQAIVGTLHGPAPELRRPSS